jgi:pseudaminic acid synthase
MLIKINKKIKIEIGKKPLLIAEISANHQGDKKNFLRHIVEAHKAGADMIKIQTYEAEDITVKKYSNKVKIKKGIWKNNSPWEIYNKAQTPYSWHEDAFKLAKKINAVLFSTPFSLKGVNFLEKFKVPIYKIASLEITDLNLIKFIASKKKPIILSTGLASYQDIRTAINLIKKYHNKIIILHCVSGYPTPIDEINLSRIELIKEKFKTKFVGLSDHTTSDEASLGSIFFGSCLIEKHFTLNKKSLDGKFSLLPNEFKKLSNKIDIFHKMIGEKKFSLKKSEKVNLSQRRSIFSIKDINAGEKLTSLNISSFRPSIGINSNLFFKVLGRKAKKKIKAFTSVKKNYLF